MVRGSRVAASQPAKWVGEHSLPSEEERRMKLRSLTIAMAVSILPALAAPAFADGVKVGTLRCDVSGGLGLIITSSKEMSCVFRSAHGYREAYYGTIRKFGLDIGATGGGVLAWAVFAPTAG